MSTSPSGIDGARASRCAAGDPRQATAIRQRAMTRPLRARVVSRSVKALSGRHADSLKIVVDGLMLRGRFVAGTGRGSC
jgi:hypothetical protein